MSMSTLRSSSHLKRVECQKGCKYDGKEDHDPEHCLTITKGFLRFNDNEEDEALNRQRHPALRLLNRSRGIVNRTFELVSNEPHKVITSCCIDKTPFRNLREKTDLDQYIVLEFDTHYWDSATSHDPPKISAPHAKVFFEKESFWIQDLNSAHGTFLNGVKLFPNQKYKMDCGSVVSLGEWVPNDYAKAVESPRAFIFNVEHCFWEESENGDNVEEGGNTNANMTDEFLLNPVARNLCRYLDLPTLKSLRLVNKSWSEFATNEVKNRTVVRRMCTFMRKDAVENSRYMSEMESFSHPKLTIRCTPAAHIDLFQGATYPATDDKPLPFFSDALWFYTEFVKDLKFLRLAVYEMGQQINNTVNGIPMLTSTPLFKWEREFIAKLLSAHAKTLEDLELCMEALDSFDVESIEPFPVMKRLTLDSGISNTLFAKGESEIEGFVLALLKLMPNLESIQFDEWCAPWIKPILANRSSTFPSLAKISFDFKMSETSFSCFANLLKSPTKNRLEKPFLAILTTLELPFLHITSQNLVDIAELLRVYSKSLKTFYLKLSDKLERRNGIEDRTLQLIFPTGITMSSLQSFRVMTFRIDQFIPEFVFGGDTVIYFPKLQELILSSLLYARTLWDGDYYWEESILDKFFPRTETSKCQCPKLQLLKVPGTEIEPEFAEYYKATLPTAGQVPDTNDALEIQLYGNLYKLNTVKELFEVMDLVLG